MRFFGWSVKNLVPFRYRLTSSRVTVAAAGGAAPPIVAPIIHSLRAVGAPVMLTHNAMDTCGNRNPAACLLIGLQ